jgi:hypothetical protein
MIKIHLYCTLCVIILHDHMLFRTSTVIPLVQVLQNIKYNMLEFNLRARLSVRFADDDGYNEGAVDAGGPRREYLRLLVK